jgi:hypothetical protein
MNSHSIQLINWIACFKERIMDTKHKTGTQVKDDFEDIWEGRRNSQQAKKGTTYKYQTTPFRRYLAEIAQDAYTTGKEKHRGRPRKYPAKAKPDRSAAQIDRQLRQVTKTCIRCKKPFTVPAAHQERRKHCSIMCCTLDRRLFEVTPEELYALVWSQPTTEVARLFGVSDKAIEKRCKRLGIPKPPRGYWLQISRIQKNA